MIYYVLIVLICLIGLVLTFYLGFSKSNQEENSQYTQNTRKNLSTLTYLNIVFVLIISALLVGFLLW